MSPQTGELIVNLIIGGPIALAMLGAVFLVVRANRRKSNRQP
jgi:hypothetical protein